MIEGVEEITDPTADQILRHLGDAGIAWRGSEMVNTGGSVMHLVVNVAWQTRGDTDGDYFDIHAGPFDTDGESLDGWISVGTDLDTDDESWAVLDIGEMRHSSDKLTEILRGFVHLRDEVARRGGPPR